MTAILAAVSAVAYLTSRGGQNERPESEDPSELGAAVFFGVLYAAVLLSVAVAKEHFGDDHPEAFRQFRRALELDPDFFVAREFLATGYLNLLDRENAEREISILEEQLDRMPLFEQAFTQDLRHTLDWDHAASLSARRRMLELAPQIRWVPFIFGLRAIELSRPREAVGVRRSLLPGPVAPRC